MGEPDETSNLRDVEALKTPPWTPAHQASLPKTPYSSRPPDINTLLKMQSNYVNKSKIIDEEGRFLIRPVSSDDGDADLLNVGTADSLSDLSYIEENKSNSAQDNYSIGNRSVLSQLTVNNIVSTPGNILPWLADPGSALGSSILLASRSYLNIYKSDPENLNTAADILDPVEEEMADDIFDNPEYIDTLEGKLPLAEAARMIAKDASKHDALFSKGHIRRAKIDAYQRIICIGVAFLFLFGSTYGARNAFNSLSKDKRLALVCYGSVYSLIWFGGICASPIIAKVKPKWCLAISTVGYVLYPASMFWPSYYVTLPASILFGFCIGIMWSSEGIYLMNTAATYSLVSGEKLSIVVGRFNGIVFSFFYCANIIGNVIVALLLGDLYTLPGENANIETIENSKNFTLRAETPEIESLNYGNRNNTEQRSICGLEFYEYQAKVNDTKPIVFIGKQKIFFGVNTLLPLIASLIIIVCLKKLKVAKRPGGGNIIKMMVLAGRTFIDKKSLLLIPLLFNFGVIASTILADYSTAFISCAYGTDKIGYVIMTAFGFSATGAILSPKIIDLIGRPAVFVTSLLIGVSSALCMLYMKPEPGSITAMSFLPVCLWALSDGILLTQTNSLLALLFRNKLAQALTMLSSCLSFGGLLATFSIALNLFSLTTKVYFAIASYVFATICYIVLEILLKKGIL